MPLDVHAPPFHEYSYAVTPTLSVEGLQPSVTLAALAAVTLRPAGVEGGVVSPRRARAVPVVAVALSFVCVALPVPLGAAGAHGDVAAETSATVERFPAVSYASTPSA